MYLLLVKKHYACCSKRDLRFSLVNAMVLESLGISGQIRPTGSVWSDLLVDCVLL